MIQACSLGEENIWRSSGIGCSVRLNPVEAGGGSNQQLGFPAGEDVRPSHGPPMPAVEDCTKRIASEALIRKTRFSVARALRNMRPILRGGLVRPPSEQYLAPCTERAGLEGAQSPSMTYVVIDSCIACKYTDCVEVCPVDCFYEGENMLVIHPDECIDCGVCEPECPVDAICPDTEPGMEKWVEFNRKFSEIWPVIIEKIDAPPGAESHEGEEGKLEKYFSERPGKGS